MYIICTLQEIVALIKMLKQPYFIPDPCYFIDVVADLLYETQYDYMHVS